MKAARTPPTWSLGNGRLYRAIVSLPDYMTERERPLQERIVFFEGPSTEPGRHLERLLALAWSTDTTAWCENGLIYNVDSSYELLHECSYCGKAPGDLRLFEIGCGGDGDYAVDPARIHYARAADVDLLVTPRVGERLREVLAQIDALYAAEPARRAAA